MKRYSKMICFFLSALLLLPAITLPEARAAEREVNQTIFEADFESGNLNDYGFWFTGGARGSTYTIEERKDGNGLGLHLTMPNDAVYMAKELDQAYKDVSLVLRFSYLREGEDKDKGLFFLRMATGKMQSIEEMLISNGSVRHNFVSTGGRATLYSNGRGWALSTEDTDYLPEKAGEWNDVVVFIDYPHSEMTFYLNGQHLKTMEINQEYMTLKAIGLNVYKGSDLWLDNISFSYMDRPDLLGLEKSNVPEKLWDFSLRPVGVTFESARVGHIFPKTEKPYFRVKYTEREGKAGNFKVNYTAKNEFGKVMWTGSDAFSLGANETAERALTVPVERYDLYHLYADVTSEDHGGWSEFTQFSWVNTPAPGYRNRDMGFVLHVGQGRAHEEQLELLDLAGCGTVRDELGHANFEKEPGVWKNPPEMEAYYKELVERDMHLFHNLSYSLQSWHGARGSESYEAGMEEWAYQTTKYFTEYGLDFTIGSYNEWNHHGDIDPEWYAGWLKAMYRGVKRANPNIWVTGGETSGVPISQVDSALAALDGEKAADAWTFHVYSYAATGPETSAHMSLTDDLQTLLDKYGYDIPIWNTENGWSTQIGMASERMQARFTTRSMAMMAATNKWEHLMLYEFQNTGVQPELRESNFGAVEFYQPSWTHPEPMAAKPIYLAYANYNAILGGTTYAETLDLGTGIHSYRFEKGEDSIIYAVAGEEPQSVGLNVGCDSVTIYDLYGNPKTVHTVDGVLTVYLDQDPIYIQGNFKSVTPGTPLFENNTPALSVAAGSRGETSVTKLTPLPVTAQVIPGGAIRENVPAVFEGNTAKVSVATDPTDAEEDVFFTDLLLDGKTVYSAKTDVTYVPSVSIASFNMVQHSALLDVWSGVFNLKNHQSDATLSGELTFTYPESVAKLLGTTKIEQILPNSAQNISVRMPSSLLGSQVSLKIDLSTGETIPMDTRLSTDGAHYAKVKPTIDGKTEPGEWNLSRATTIRNDTGETALTFAMMWDEENLYFYGLTRDEKFYQQVEVASNMWQQDSIQLALCSRDSSAAYTELGFALLPTGPTSYAWSFESGMGKDANVVEEVELAVSRINAENTLYEARIPWEAVVTDPETVLSSGAFKMDILLNNNDAGSRQFIEYCYGIANAKDVKLMTRFSLME